MVGRSFVLEAISAHQAYLNDNDLTVTGIDIAAHNVHVSGVDIANGDDSLCVKSPASNVLIENSVVRHGNGL